MHSDFKVVKRKRQRKRKIELENPAGVEFDFQVYFNGKFKKVLEEFESSRFCFELLQTIHSCLSSLDSDHINGILSYGLGNFLDSKSSLHQLAALVEIQKKYRTSVLVYDPVFTSSEIEILRELNFHVLPDNEEGKRKISCDEVTLVFLPHCPKQLVNNFLWANWSTALCRCILITNSFFKIIQDNTQKDLQQFANYILKISQRTKEIPLEDCYNIENIFNDISVHYFRLQDFESNFFSDTLDNEPLYLGETELITKKFSSLAVKNE